MIENIDSSLIDWSRAQFALTAIYHWVFVPLTLGLAVVMGIMETLYYRSGDEFWQRTAKFWMKLFGINFAVGIATGLILEFEFGTNWSNYSWFVGDIFGAPLAIEGIVAFFMESTFVAVMFFGWEKVSKGFHLASTWLTGAGATISAWWILVANSWMQHPVGMEFNPDTARNEMISFAEVALSPFAVSKFFHTVTSAWVLGAIFVIGVSCWYLLKGREKKFALESIKIGAIVGLVAAGLTALTGDESGHQVAQHQPMKLAAMEGLYQGESGAGLTAIAMLNPSKQSPKDGVEPYLFEIKIPYMLSLLADRDINSFVPGINDLLDGGYQQKDGTKALSVEEKIAKGKLAIAAFAAYRKARAAGNDAEAKVQAGIMRENMPYFGYGHIRQVNDVVPPVALTFYMFRIMVMLGGYFILFFLVVLYLVYKKDIAGMKWLHWVAIITIPLGYLASQAGWAVAEVGRQPWVIQDMMPTNVAISQVSVGSVQLTFFIFLALFTILLIAEIGIMLKAIKHGPDFK
jgi:cytochrome d ubiquinol oxidase subunit I